MTGVELFPTIQEDLIRESKELERADCVKPVGLMLRMSDGSTKPVHTPCQSAFYSRCKSCAARHSRDRYIIATSGVRELSMTDEGITWKEAGTEYDYFFLTLTLPSFGAVHTGGNNNLCRCGRRHTASADVLGLPIDHETYDRKGMALANLVASRLWNRTAKKLRDYLDFEHFGVWEYQKRGAMHLHVLIRTESGSGLDDPNSVAHDDLLSLVTSTRVTAKDNHRIGWGDQYDVTRIDPTATDEDSLSTVTYALKTLGYVQKDLLDDQEQEEKTKMRPAVKQAWDLLEKEVGAYAMSQRQSKKTRLRPLEDETRVSEYGFHGNRVTKSRRWSLTVPLSHIELRRRRAAYQRKKQELDEGEAQLDIEAGWCIGTIPNLAAAEEADQKHNNVRECKRLQRRHGGDVKTRDAVQLDVS